MATKIEAMRGEDGKLPAYAWPGGYPMLYVTPEGWSLCPDCANNGDWHLQDGDANWEDPNLFCEDCGKRIESAYAED
jgi:hypothetical protein